MARAKNRRAKRSRSGSSAPSRGRKRAPRSSNRKAAPGGRKRGPKVERGERKVRNRTFLLLTLLALVNAYVFVWRDEGALAGLSALPSAAMASTTGPLPPRADPPDDGCTDHPVRIFEGLSDLVMLETSLSHGRTPRLAMLGLGVPAREIDAVEAAIRSHVDLALLGGSGAPLRVALDRFGGVHALEVELAEGHVLQACKAPTGLQVRSLQHPLRSDVLALGLELGRRADLGDAVAQAGEAPELATLVARTLAHDVDFLTEARPGDRVQVMVEKRWLGSAFHRYGRVLAVRYAGAMGRVGYYRYKAGNTDAAFYDRRGEPMRRALLRSPVAYHAVDLDARGMLAPNVEIVAGTIGAAYRQAEGAPIVALGSGVIRQLGRRGDQGIVLEIEVEDGTVVRYAHLMRVIGDLEIGSRVDQGQVVGLAGHTGKTATDRVRLELWREQDGELRPIDPMSITARGDRRAPPVGDRISDDLIRRFRDDTGPWGKALLAAAR